ncbi:alpha/beta fold hydrolase [Roseobacter sp. HKCCA0434]|uniref:alpha/beta fold hydrolase n=1 Tax=Roseobacter sp. HKCCA0434 TaxID=3079297 RepID=UPI002905E8B3|nr:alpha/beta fold hydrolase [Roseobacter sp. HKCCA0434]
MTLILIPGHLCDGRLYAPQLDAFPDAVVADVTRDDDLGAMAGRLLAEAPERFDIAGLSMGGMVAMEVMARAPERVRSATLMATDPTQARDIETDWRAERQEEVREHGLGRFTTAFARMFFAHDTEVAERLMPQVEEMQDAADADLYHRQCRALDTRRDMLGPLEGCAIPTEILVGTEDRICPPKLHDRLAAVLTNATLTKIEGCGHLLTLERPEVATDALRRATSRPAA